MGGGGQKNSTDFGVTRNLLERQGKGWRWMSIKIGWGK